MTKQELQTSCIWEECDQEAIYCAGHAEEFMLPQKLRLESEIDRLSTENKRLIKSLKDVLYRANARDHYKAAHELLKELGELS